MHDEIVICGMSGKFPKSKNVEEFWCNLINGVDMLSDDNSRWDTDVYDMAKRTGKLPNLERFDAKFFGVPSKQVNVMDPKIRLAHELTYEAIVDAGVSPETLRGSKTAVFIGTGGEEAGEIWKRCSEKPSGYISTGCFAFMTANRVSFSMDFVGPSYAVDVACSSSLFAVEHAYQNLKHGLVDSAIVGGVNLCLSPLSSLCYHDLGILSKDGKCKVFDAKASGYVRSEAAVMMYLCLGPFAKRSYANIVHAKCNSDGYKEAGISYPSQRLLQQLVIEFYKECKVNPNDVGYIEAHGTGTKVGDPREINALASVFCQSRMRPLLVGSVKSNMGHSEFAAGMCGIAKVLLSHQHGVLPGNLHFQTPNPDILPLQDGRIIVVASNVPFNEEYAAINSFGVGGSNAHILLRLSPKLGFTEFNTSFPILVTVSGRTKESVTELVSQLKLHARNPNLIGLFHEISKTLTKKHPHRGYICYDEGNNSVLTKDYDALSSKSIWFIFNGLGGQWTGMCRDLVNIEMFRNSIARSAETLKKENFDLMETLNSSRRTLTDDLKNAIVSTTAVQVGFVNVLKSVGVCCSGIIGHSTGEVAAAYADGCFGEEQTVLVSLARATAFVESDLPEGAMATIAISWNEAKTRCPNDVFPAISNSKSSVTVAGPKESIKALIQVFKNEGIFVKQIQSAPYAFHSPYVQNCETRMRNLLNRCILEPRKRSSKWLSSSIPAMDWGTELAKYSSVDYHVNNALSPVRFYETLLHIPDEALVLEIGPHCFMQTVLKQTLPSVKAIFGVMNKHAMDNASYFLNVLGKLYLEGLTLDLGTLYPPVNFPVCPETPSISPWIVWDHLQTWDVPRINNELSNVNGYKISIDIQSEDFKYLEDHTVDGRIVFPATGYIWLVWKAFAQQQKSNFEQLPVVFENLRFERSTVLNPEVVTDFNVVMLPNGGRFEVVEGMTLVFQGCVRQLGNDLAEIHLPSSEDVGNCNDVITKRDFYKELHLRGYGHSGPFQGVETISIEGTGAQLRWNENWVCFLDSLLQVSLLNTYQRGLYLPTQIKKLTVDPSSFKRWLSATESVILPMTYSKHTDVKQCPGVELRGLKIGLSTQKIPEPRLSLTECRFLPFCDKEPNDTSTALDFCIGIVLDNVRTKKLIFTELFSNCLSESIGLQVASHCVMCIEALECRFVNNSSTASSDVKVINDCNIHSLPDLVASEPCHLLYTDDPGNYDHLEELVVPFGFLLLKNNLFPSLHNFVQTASLQCEDGSSLTLYRKLEIKLSLSSIFVSLDGPDFLWVEQIKTQLASNNYERIILTAKSVSGAQGLTKCLIAEPGSEKVRCVIIKSAARNSINDFESKEILAQLELDLVFNVYKGGVWGCYSNILLHDTLETSLCCNAYADITHPGDLSSLRWIESPTKLATKSNSLVRISYASLNFRDLMLATGKLPRSALPGKIRPDDCVVGYEYSGLQGSTRVCGFSVLGCISTCVEPDSHFMWEVPKRWSMKEAATVPAVYSTVYYALIIRGNMEPGDTVLVHAGAGGVGIAAITLALSMKCKVYTTVGSVAKRKFLLQRFPQLEEKDITDSRSANKFEKHVMEQTEGRGVDIVLNSLAGDKFFASLNCLALHGKFLELGKFDLVSDTSIGASILLRDVSVHGISMDQLGAGWSKCKSKVFQLVSDGIESSVVQPLPTTVFSSEQLEDAFRYMANGKHIGKVLINMEARLKQFQALTRTFFHPHKSYILIGGLGGMGLEMAIWMVNRGARIIILNSRSGIKNTYQGYHLEKLKSEFRAQISINHIDASTPDGAMELLKNAAMFGPVGGIFNVALVLHDAVFENQTPSFFKAVCVAKSQVTQELDIASRELAPHLDHFVAFSSITSAKGNAGQTNYGYGNSFAEDVCERRKDDGLPALAIQWGPIDNVGALFENKSLSRQLRGIEPQKISSWLHTLDLLLQQDKVIVGSYVRAQSQTVSAGPAQRSFLHKVAHVLGIRDMSEVNLSSTLLELGMDSLMDTEIRQILPSKLGGIAPALKQLTLEQISKLDTVEKQQEQQFHQPILEMPSDRSKIEIRTKIYPIPQKTVRKLQSLEHSPSNIFVVHPMDGTLTSLEPLISQLNNTFYGIECTAKAPLNSIEELATFYISNMKNVQPQGPYKIAGYSYGGVVAFEMALQLERAKEKLDFLLLLDSYPKLSQLYYSHVTTDLGAALDMEDYLIHFLVAHVQTDPNQARKELTSLASWNERVEHVARITKRAFKEFEVGALRDLAENHALRVKSLENYQPSGKTDCKTVLFKCLKASFSKLVPKDYGLNEMCRQHVEVIEINGDHEAFVNSPTELRISESINETIAKIMTG